MKSAHQSIGGGHIGVRKTESKLAMKAYWVGCTVDVREYCKKCDKCAPYQRSRVDYKQCASVRPGKEWLSISLGLIRCLVRAINS